MYINIYVPDGRPSKSMKQNLTELKWETKFYNNSRRVQYLTLSSKEIEDLNNTLNQLDLTDKYSTLCPTTTQYTFFKIHGFFFSNIMELGHKVSTFEKIDIMWYISSDQNWMNLEINNRRKTGKFVNLWKLYLIFKLLNNQSLKKQITREIRK